MRQCHEDTYHEVGDTDSERGTFDVVLFVRKINFSSTKLNEV